MRRVRLRAVVPAAVLAAGLAFGLSACAASSEETAVAMHGSVVQISERAAAGDYAGALAELALLERDVASAAERGSIDADREARIRAAMDVVRADLEAADGASTPAPEPQPEPQPDPGQDQSGPGGDGNQDGDNGNDDQGDNPNKGPGNNSGNGNSGKGGG